MRSEISCAIKMFAALGRSSVTRSSNFNRTFSRSISLSLQRFDRDTVSTRLNNLHDHILSSNWADPVSLALDVPFWEAETDKVITMVDPFLADPEIGQKAQQLNSMLDCFYSCEDTRDFLIEVGELGSRATGVMGTGFLSGEKVENVEEIAQAAVKRYEELIAKYPTFKPKIEQSVGHGIATLRSKSKFRYGEMHRYFF